MELTCPRCGKNNPEGFVFCGFCAAPLGESRARIEERKTVTILFCDQVGFTASSDHADPEDVRARVDPYFARLRRSAEAYGGTVDKFIGDAIMAVFGAPLAHEDDPERAVRAALRILEEIADLNASDPSLSLSVRIGINTGEVLARTEPADWAEGLVTGDVVNTASRLQSVAPEGTVVVSESTYAATRGVFDFEKLDPVRVKGKSDPLPIWRVDGSRGRFGVDLIRTRSAELVGREDEVELLARSFSLSLRDRSVHLVTIIGEPGVGKSRLVAELPGRLEDQPQLVTWRQGRCLPYGEGITFWAMGEIVKAEAGIFETDPPETAAAKLDAAVADDDPEAHWIRQRLRPLVGLDAPQAAREENFAAWRRFLEGIAERAPTVVVFEDLHWADDALLAFIEHVVSYAEGVPLLLVATARPELYERAPNWAASARNVARVDLEPLSEPQTARLIANLLEHAVLPAEAEQAILSRSGGNPLYAEEFVRLLEDTGILAKRGEIWFLDPQADIPVPSGISGIIAARLDALAPERKRMLADASVIGTVFWSGAVAAIGGAGQDDVEKAMHELSRKDLIRRARRSSMQGEHEYAFWHALLRDACYAQIPRAQRAERHVRAAAWIEAQAGERVEDFSEILAAHYSTALELARAAKDTDTADLTTRPLRFLTLTDDEVIGIESLRAKACRSALEASRSARSRLVLDVAQRMAERALTLATEPDERSEALAARGETYFLSSQGDQAWSSLRESIDARVEASLPAPDATTARLCARALEIVTRGRGSMRSRLSRDEASRYLEVGLGNVAEGDSEELTRLLTVQAFWPYSFREDPGDEDELERARQAGERAAEMADRLGRPDLASAALDGVGAYYLSQGLFGKMDSVTESRLRLAAELDDPLEVGDVYAVAAWTAFHVGRYRRAVTLADEGVRRTTPGAQIMALYCLDFRALARCRLGEWDEFLRDVDRIGELLGDRRDHPPGFASDHVAAAAFVHEVMDERANADRMLRVLDWLEEAEVRPSPGWTVWRALVLSRRGAFAAARELLARPEEGFRWGPGYRLEALCDVVAEQGAWADAPQIVDAARRHAAHAGLLALPAYADRLEGRMRLATGEPEAGIALLRTATAGFTAFEARWEAARSSLWLAEALVERGSGDEALRLATAARAVFEELRSIRERDQASSLVE